MKIWPFEKRKIKKLHHPATISNIASITILVLVLLLSYHYAPNIAKEQGRDFAMDITDDGKSEKNRPDAPGVTAQPEKSQPTIPQSSK